MELAASAGYVTNFAVGHAYRQIDYVVHFRTKIKNLQIKAQQLTSTRGDLQRLIDIARNNNELVRETVTDWLEKVVQRVVFHSLYSWQKTSKKCIVIQELLDEKITFGNLADPKPIQSFTPVNVEDVDVFASRKYTTKKVLDAMRNDNVSLVGIYGMPGVGKTMLLQGALKQAKEEKLFDEVVMVIVSQNPDVEQIQQGIARQLGLSLGESSIPAAQLSGHLNQGKKVLIALDDVWERLDLTKVGIDVQGCKVVFTTRIQDVCAQMNAHVKIEVGLLSKEESWRLFRQKAGDVVDSSTHHAIAREVLNECKGLPLAIITLGLTLRDKDEIVWMDARAQLKKSVYEDMNHVVPLVKLSYKYLQNDTARKCFLFCCLFPEDFKIDTHVLLTYMLGEKIVKDADTMEEARYRIHAIIKKLTSAGLLLTTEKGDIMMHDVIRDAAVCIASDSEEGEGFIVKSGLGLKDWPAVELGKCKQLSLMSNNLRFAPPYKIIAPHLLTLSLSDNEGLEEVPDDFFSEMTNLKTLDLSCTGIQSLPQSFACLQSLCTLRMDSCRRLTAISLVAELERLEILSIRDSSCVKIPQTMRKLTMLKILDSSANMFPPKVISSLYRLEELHLLDGLDSTFSEVVSLTRLTCLEMRLSTECLSQGIPLHWNSLSKFTIAIGASLMDFREVRNRGRKRRYNTTMYLNFPSSIPVSNCVRVLLNRTEFLQLDSCQHLQTVLDLNAFGSFQKLRRLAVHNCHLMRYILSTAGVAKSMFSDLEVINLSFSANLVAFCNGTFPQGFLCKLRVLRVDICKGMLTLIPCDVLLRLQNLEKIHLYVMDKLEKLIHSDGLLDSAFSSPIFPNLREVVISKCPRLKTVLPMKATRHLFQLERFEVNYCMGLKTIIEYDDYDEGNSKKDMVALPRLKVLTLLNLENLSTFGCPSLRVDCPNLVRLTVRNCGNLKSLPLDYHCLPNLKEHEVYFNGVLQSLVT